MGEAFKLGEAQVVPELREVLRRERVASDRLERDERSAALELHNAKWRDIRAALMKRCEALGGHQWTDLPHNGFNRPHFLTGNWPQRCRICNTKHHG